MTDEKIVVDGTIVEAETTNRPAAPPKEKFTLNFLFERSDWTPDNFKQWREWNERMEELLRDGVEPDPFYGWRRYEIGTKLESYVVIAKRTKNGGWHIKDWIASPR